MPPRVQYVGSSDTGDGHVMHHYVDDKGNEFTVPDSISPKEPAEAQVHPVPETAGMSPMPVAKYRSNIEDRRFENVQPVPDRKGTLTEHLPAVPAEMRKYKMKIHETRNYQRRMDGHPEVPMPADLKPAAPDFRAQAVAGLRKKLGL